MTGLWRVPIEAKGARAGPADSVEGGFHVPSCHADNFLHVVGTFKLDFNWLSISIRPLRCYLPGKLYNLV